MPGFGRLLALVEVPEASGTSLWMKQMSPPEPGTFPSSLSSLELPSTTGKGGGEVVQWWPTYSKRSVSEMMRPDRRIKSALNPLIIYHFSDRRD
jgi:hypothetical protein